MEADNTRPRYVPYTIKVKRDGDLQEVNPRDLTNSELCHLLSELSIDSEFSTSDECHDWNLAIEEAVGRLKQNGEQDNFGHLYDAKAVGNAAKLREVMKVIHRIAYDAKSDFDVFAGIEKINRISADALAAPPRQCDIGTAEEQRRRYDEWRNHDGLRAALGKDEFEWAQMPYNESEANNGEVS